MIYFILITILALIGIVALLFFLFFNKEKEKHEETKFSIFIVWSDNSITTGFKSELESVLDDLVSFWTEKTNLSSKEIENCFKGLSLFFYDEVSVKCVDGRLISGAANPTEKRIIITTIPKMEIYTEEKIKEKIISLLFHEFSHIIVFYLTSLNEMCYILNIPDEERENFSTEEIHHLYFEKIGLNEFTRLYYLGK